MKKLPHIEGGVSTIRPATILDLPAIQLLAEHLALHLEEAAMPVLTATEIVPFFFRTDAPMHMAVAEDKEGVIGVITWMLHFDLHNGQRRVFIGDLSVRRDCRRNKIGEALIKHVIAWGKENKAKRIAWEVWERNEIAKAFYAKQGATLVRDEIAYCLPIDA